MIKKFVFLLPLFSFQCFFINLVDDISFKVISSGGGHVGHYIADNGQIQYFEGGSMINGISSYELNLGPVETLTVSATSKPGATSISIVVYKGAEIAKEEKLANFSQASTVTLNYTYGELPPDPNAVP